MADSNLHEWESLQLRQDTLIELYELDLEPIGISATYRFTADKYFNGSYVYYKGQPYSCLNILASGFESSHTAPFPRPSLRVSNVMGGISSMLLLYEDLVGAKITRRRVFKKYLGDSSPPEAPVEVYYIERKESENEFTIDFELVSGIQLNNAILPARMITRRCQWLYRGSECQYTGTAYFDKNDQRTTDPSLDECAKRLTSCKLRFGENNQLNFGGFPSIDNY
jgi:lambda family phage minor tail protein L